jgi:hypothetical protein
MLKRNTGARIRTAANGKFASAARTREEPSALEGKLVQYAMAGKLEKAARDAVHAQQEQGLAVTFKRGEQIIKRYPDGREEVLAKVAAAPKYVRPKGVAVLRRK